MPSQTCLASKAPSALPALPPHLPPAHWSYIDSHPASQPGRLWIGATRTLFPSSHPPITRQHTHTHTHTHTRAWLINSHCSVRQGHAARRLNTMPRSWQLCWDTSQKLLMHFSIVLFQWKLSTLIPQLPAAACMYISLVCSVSHYQCLCTWHSQVSAWSVL